MKDQREEEESQLNDDEDIELDEEIADIIELDTIGLA